MKQTFSKDERLCGRVQITKLFAEGSVFHIKPFRVIWKYQETRSAIPARVLMSVPKYNIKKAVDRNLIRRRMREAYRKNKTILYRFLEESGRGMTFSITYTSKEIMTSDIIRDKIIVLLQRLSEENEKVTG